jgi:hypothetical protein
MKILLQNEYEKMLVDSEKISMIKKLSEMILIFNS